MTFQPWQQHIFDQITSGGLKPGELMVMTAGRNVGKSLMNQQAIDRLMRDLNSRPIEELVLAESRIYGSRFYTVEPVGGNWLEMETWAHKVYGPASNAWISAEDLPNCRWLSNNRKFWFRKETDRTMFILKWSSHD
jgi:hypothetical protein